MPVAVPHLSHQDADDHAQLVQRAEGTTDSGGGDLAHVHGRQARAQATEAADNEPADDDQLKGLTHDGQAHQAATDQRQQVVQQHRLASRHAREEKGQAAVHTVKINNFFSDRIKM